MRAAAYAAKNFQQSNKGKAIHAMEPTASDLLKSHTRA